MNLPTNEQWVGGIIGIGIAILSTLLTLAAINGAKKFREWQYNRVFFKNFEKTREKFLAEELETFVSKPLKLKSTKEERPPQENDLCDYIFIRDVEYSDKSPPLKMIREFLDYGIGKEVAYSLRDRGYSQPLIEALVPKYKERYFEEYLARKSVKNDRTVDTLRQELNTPDDPAKAHLFEKIYPVIYQSIKKKESVGQTNDLYKQKVLETTADQKYLQMLPLLRTTQVLETDDTLDSQDHVSLSDEAREKLRALRHAYYENFVEFTKLTSREKLRSEQIYAYILMFPGHYATQMSKNADIPYSTITRYVDALEELNLVVRHPATHEGKYRKELYPRIEQKEILNTRELANGTPICLVSKVIENNGKKLEEYPEIEINLEDAIVGKFARVIGILNRGKSRVRIIEPEITQYTAE